ncbi:MAG: flagellar hook-associated protein 2 [Thermoanaerobacteraceae bacterium]|nr:flagellar hook-associated protein 2 [Thermoanaerobacteraceae bacterium]
MVLRVSGLATGMDIESIVKDLMKAERIPLDKLQQEKQLLEWKQEDYREINKSLFELRDVVFDMKLQGTFNTKNAASSNESVLEAAAGGSATEGIYTVTVNSLAEGVSKASTAGLADETDNGNTKTLYQQFQAEFDARGITSTDNISFTLNGTTITVDLDQDNIYTLVSKINDADLGVKASYDADLNRFFLTTETTGSSAQITVSADSANLLSTGTNNSILKLNLDTGTTYTGKDASYDFGDAKGLTSSTNSATINGLTLYFKGTGTATVTVTRDTDALFEKIKDFVEKYNETLEKITEKLQEKRYRDYPPLTEAQKEEMTDKQVELWEEKARSGLLRNDWILNDLVSNMRMAVNSIVENISSQYKSLAEIGISTSNWYEMGKLHINEDKLKEALNKDPEGIKKLFTNASDIDSEKGIAYKLYDVVVNGTERITDKAGRDSSFSLVDNSYIGEKLRQMNEEIDQWEERLNEIEDRYWREFTRMERAINQMNAQSMWLAQQFGGGM